MRFYMLTLPNGSTIRSGVPGEDAICALTLTHAVCDAQELSFGACCAAMLEVEIFYYNEPPVSQGDRLQVFGIDGDALTPLGIFYAEKPELDGPHRLKLTAYDPVSRLDRDLTDWLSALDGWPYSAGEFADMVCNACGVELRAGDVVNGEFPIEAFTGKVTGRRLMQWLGQIFGRFLFADETGILTWGWYTENKKIRLGPQSFTGYVPLEADFAEGNLTVSRAKASFQGSDLQLSDICQVISGSSLWLYADSWLEQYYLMDSLTHAAYGVAPISRVRIRKNQEDVGVSYPEEAQGNTYILEGNPMLEAGDREGVAMELFRVLEGISYVPCTATVPEGIGIRAGDLLKVTDAQGRSFVTAVMQYKEEDGCVYIESTGSASRDSATAANSYSYEALSGKVMNLKMNVDGLFAENRDQGKALAQLRLSVDGLETRVQAQEATATQLTQLSQTSDALQLQVQSIWQDGVNRVQTETGYTFDREGLRITKSGQVMENVLDNTGMYVRRGDEIILQANDAGVSAVDVQVKNYLILGSHSRLEDYATVEDPCRTACFYL